MRLEQRIKDQALALGFELAGTHSRFGDSQGHEPMLAPDLRIGSLRGSACRAHEYDAALSRRLLRTDSSCTATP